MSYETLTLERDDQVATITLNRPESLNAISWRMVEDLHAVLSELEEDFATRVVILTGAGRGFCSGTDLKSGREEAPPTDQSKMVSQLARRQRKIADVILRMRKIPQPIVCAVNGVAAGGGFSFAMASDVRVASETARFICSFINIGLTAGDLGSSYHLPRLIGQSRAAELLLTGRPIEADEAERVGLVSRVVPQSDVVNAARDVAAAMLTKSPLGLRLTKEVLNHSLDASSLESMLYMENRQQSLAVLSGDFQVAIKAFQEKRPPEFPPEV